MKTDIITGISTVAATVALAASMLIFGGIAVNSIHERALQRNAKIEREADLKVLYNEFKTCTEPQTLAERLAKDNPCNKWRDAYFTLRNAQQIR